MVSAGASVVSAGASVVSAGASVVSTVASVAASVVTVVSTGSESVLQATKTRIRVATRAKRRTIFLFMVKFPFFFYNVRVF